MYNFELVAFKPTLYFLMKMVLSYPKSDETNFPHLCKDLIEGLTPTNSCQPPQNLLLKIVKYRDKNLQFTRPR